MRETAEGVKTRGARVGIGREIFFTARTVALIELMRRGDTDNIENARDGVTGERMQQNAKLICKTKFYFYLLVNLINALLCNHSPSRAYARDGATRGRMQQNTIFETKRWFHVFVNLKLSFEITHLLAPPVAISTAQLPIVGPCCKPTRANRFCI